MLILKQFGFKLTLFHKLNLLWEFQREKVIRQKEDLLRWRYMCLLTYALEVCRVCFYFEQGQVHHT